MADSMLDILTMHRDGVGDPDMVGDEMAKARAELRGWYDQWAKAPSRSGPEYEWLALRSAAAVPTLLDTIDFLRDTLARIARGQEPTRAERDASEWWGTTDYEPVEAIASMARRLTGEG